jgi:uncharacterized protein YggE
MKQQSWKLISVLSLALVAVLIAALVGVAVGASPAAALPAQGGAPTGTITVSGSGEATGSPDVAYVSLGVEVMNADLGAALAETNTKMTAIIGAIRELGIAAEDMQTLQFGVWSDTSGAPSPMGGGGTPGTITGIVYHVTNIMRITVRDTSQVQAVVDSAVSAGANNIQGLNFGLDDPAALEREARIKALDDARERASQIAAAIGVTLGEPMTVTEGSISGYPTIQMAAAPGYGAGGGGFQEGQLSVSVEVQVTYDVIR